MQSSNFSAIIGGKCPRCRKARMFPKPLYSKDALKMDEFCSHCHFQYEIQPGFFWGAMFVNYAFVAAIFGIETTLLYWWGIMDSIWLYIVSPVTCIVLLPVIFRAGRVLFLHLFGGVEYKPGQES